MSSQVDTMTEAREHKKIVDVVLLAKPGITLMVLLTAAIGYVLADGAWSLLLVHLMAGTALLAGGTAALNMWMERNADSKMHRTENRPLPAGRLAPATALIFGSIFSLAGTAYLALLVHPMAAGFGVASGVIYVFAYTPLKKVSSLNTIVGAVVGALPPVMGWAAARGEVGIGAAVLFSVLFFWQLPHFLAIAWMYREDYARAGFRMLTLDDETGVGTAMQVILQTSALLIASLAPAVIGTAGVSYLIGALVLGVTFLAFGVFFALKRTRGRARALFFASIAYLPILLAWMVLGAQ